MVSQFSLRSLTFVVRRIASGQTTIMLILTLTMAANANKTYA